MEMTSSFQDESGDCNRDNHDKEEDITAIERGA